MILCTLPECQTTAGCMCPKLVSMSYPNADLNRVGLLKDEIEMLKEKVRLHCADAKVAWAECDALRSELANARNALLPFAESDMRFLYETGHCESEASCVVGICDFTVGDLLRAAAALKAEGESR